MRKIILIIFTVFLLASCAMEDVSNNYNDSEIGVRAAGEVAELSSTSDTSRSITFDKDCFFRSFVIDFGIDWSETEAAEKYYTYFFVKKDETYVVLVNNIGDGRELRLFYHLKDI